MAFTSKIKFSYLSVGFLKIALKSTDFFFYPTMVTLLMLALLLPFSPISVIINPSFEDKSRVWAI
jgi:hypothetical protein